MRRFAGDQANGALAAVFPSLAALHAPPLDVPRLPSVDVQRAPLVRGRQLLGSPCLRTLMEADGVSLLEAPTPAAQAQPIAAGVCQDWPRLRPARPERDVVIAPLRVWLLRQLCACQHVQHRWLVLATCARIRAQMEPARLRQRGPRARAHRPESAPDALLGHMALNISQRMGSPEQSTHSKEVELRSYDLRSGRRVRLPSLLLS
mmetsp:Transcript_38929/g.88417  ORF Transcript_38929/g.88417 Transcript_38929/m.88417 type:complete len:205 (+) Transcript_38929:193-807(+)